MDELQIYEKDGLFHNIIKTSQIMAGRYAAINDGSEMNIGNIITHLDAVKPTFPITVCTVPYSQIDFVNSGNSPGRESYIFRLWFLCTTNYTGDNKIKFNDPATNTSLHNARFDISDMKQVCFSFIQTLEALERKTMSRTFSLSGPGNTHKIERIIKANSANLSGVYITFGMDVPLDCDSYTDVVRPDNILDYLNVPAHATHFH